MDTRHEVYFQDSRNMKELEDNSVDLVVTSPPYPMIKMWDDCFSGMNRDIGSALGSGDGRSAFTMMHSELDTVWREIFRILKNGGIACINIGDATRKIDDSFKLYPNHARVSAGLFELGFDPLPVILWRKQTNAPNKFMGSGMLPAGAYVTLEHEYVLIFRKGERRIFAAGGEKQNRRRSALFWEERNTWYSDIWDFKGARQTLGSGETRNRSGAFPPELVYRLICMYSVYGDTVLDPFLGTGTTMLAAAATGRNSLGYEIDPSMITSIEDRMREAVGYSSDKANQRLRNHLQFMNEHTTRNGTPAHSNGRYGFPVVTSQETDLELVAAKDVEQHRENEFLVRCSRFEPVE